MELTVLNHAAVRACLARRQSLPTLSTSFSRLVELAANPNVEMLDLAETIASDPVVMANVLRVANSSYMGLQRPVDDLPSAIIYLGMGEVKRIALSVGSLDVFRVKREGGVLLKRIWLHSLLTGLISQQIAALGQFDFVDDAYYSGLLHDLGKLFFSLFFSSVYTSLRQEVMAGRGEGLILEQHVFGMTHVDAAEDLCRHWKLPAKIASVAWKHHDPLLAQ
jgi:HD-like signal output (HDOD) protein